MPFYQQPRPIRFTPDTPVEMHFHDHDETWVIMGGAGIATMVDRDGTRSEFPVQAGDIWMVEAGVEHGVVPTTDELLIFPFPGTLPVGCHPPGHYYLDQEGYMPTLYLVKEPLSTRRKASHP